MENNNKTHPLQSVMDVIYPRNPDYPRDALIPAVTRTDNGAVVSALVLVRDERLPFFTEEGDIAASMTLSSREEESVRHLVMELALKKGDTTFTIFGEVDGRNVPRLHRFTEAFGEAKELLFFAADGRHQLKTVLEIPLDPKRHRGMLNRF